MIKIALLLKSMDDIFNKFFIKFFKIQALNTIKS